MKKRIYTFIGLIIVLTVSSAVAVRAQSATIGRAQIPFEFGVKNQTMAAGGYKLELPNSGGAVWSLRSRDNRQSVMFLGATVGAEKTSGNGKMTFRRYGNKYFLASVELTACEIKFGKSRAERRLEKQLEDDSRLAKNNVNDAKPEIVHVELAM